MVPVGGRVTSLKTAVADDGTVAKMTFVVDAPGSRDTFVCGNGKGREVETVAKGGVFSHMEWDDEACSEDGVRAKHIVIVSAGKGANGSGDDDECDTPGGGGVKPGDHLLSNWKEGAYEANKIEVGESSANVDNAAGFTFKVGPHDADVKSIKVPLKINPANAVGQCRLSLQTTDADGMPTGVILGEKTVDGLTKDPSVVELNPNKIVTKGVKYAFVVDECTKPGFWLGSKVHVPFTSMDKWEPVFYVQRRGNSGWKKINASNKDAMILIDGDVKLV